MKNAHNVVQVLDIPISKITRPEHQTMQGRRGMTVELR